VDGDISNGISGGVGRGVDGDGVGVVMDGGGGGGGGGGSGSGGVGRSFEIRKVALQHKARFAAILCVCFMSAGFWAVYEQQGNTTALFADDHVNRGGVPTEFVQVSSDHVRGSCEHHVDTKVKASLISSENS